MEINHFFILVLSVLLLQAAEVDGWRRRRRRRRCQPIKCKVSEWSPYWSSCSHKCGSTGTKFKTRTVKRAALCGGHCPHLKIFSPCNRACPNGGRPVPGRCVCRSNYRGVCCTIADGSWSPWQPWGSCNRACGVGQQSRSRKCTNPAPTKDGQPCTGPLTQQRSCQIKLCPVDGQWSLWTPWSPCSKRCGPGHRHRRRMCTSPAPAHGGKPCFGPLKERKSCHIKLCPVNGRWSKWTGWSRCSQTCGSGHQYRRRTCTNPAPAHGGIRCSGADKEGRFCQINSCPVNGGWTKWTPWSSCTQTCGPGYQHRGRTCSNPAPAHGGNPCSGLDKEIKVCQPKLCPVHGHWSIWEAWSRCTQSCGSGHHQRRRTCTNPAPANGGKPCRGPGKKERFCQITPCPVDGRWSGWATWSPCSHTCGSGQQNRRRTCINPAPAHGGEQCIGVSEEQRPCQTKPCPVDGVWSNWDSWTPCSHTCGAGHQYRWRSCANPSPAHGGKPCTGEKTEKRPCVIRKCPVDGQWSPWENWSECSKTCGTGTKSRVRGCYNPPPTDGGKNCSGLAAEQQTCITHNICLKPLGCFVGYPNPFPRLLADLRDHLDFTNLTKVIQECARLAKRNACSIFAIQNYCECFVDPTGANAYDKNGVSTMCANGVGGDYNNFVYEIPD